MLFSDTLNRILYIKYQPKIKFLDTCISHHKFWQAKFSSQNNIFFLHVPASFLDVFVLTKNNFPFINYYRVGSYMAKNQLKT